MSDDTSHSDDWVSRNDLPDSLFPAKSEALRVHNTAELERLAMQPQKLLSVPKDLPFPKRRQLSGLAQFGGRTLAGNRKSLGNLRRRVHNPLRYQA